MNLLIYCYIMGKISNLKKEHLLHEEDLLHIGSVEKRWGNFLN